MATSAEDNLPIPGSVVLLDLNRNEEANIVLSPAPSNDLNDPLRWSTRRKQLHHAMLVVYTLCAGMSCTSLYSVLVPVSVNTGISVATLVAGTGYMFLLLGWGGVITQPLALTFGKRPLYLVSMLGNLGTVIWMAYIRNESEWLANKVIQGLFASPIEMLIEVSIADIFYAHERGFYIGIYGMVLFGSNFLAPAWAGFVNDALGYQWVFYVTAIQQAIGTLLLFFFLEETNYNRGTTERADVHEPTNVTRGILSEEEKNIAASSSKDVVNVAVAPAALEGEEYSYTYKIGLYRQRYTSMSTFVTMIWRPLLLLRFPVVVWSGVLYGSALIWYNVLNATASPILSAAPYNFSASFVGLSYLGPTIGSVVAWAWSGWVSDRFSLAYARKKNGVREPEDRLWLLTMNAIICPVGLILWGVGAARSVHWFGLVVGGSMVAFTSASGGAAAINYALDSYKDLGGEVMITVMLIRNSMSFAIGYGITPWIGGMGLQNTFIFAAMLGLAVYASFLIVIKYGKQWRSSSRATYWRYVDSNVMPVH